MKHGRNSNGIYRLFLEDYLLRILELKRYDLLRREALDISTSILKERVKAEIYPLLSIDHLIEYVSKK